MGREWLMLLFVGHQWTNHVLLTNHLLSPGFSCPIYKTINNCFIRTKQPCTIWFLESLKSSFSICKNEVGRGTLAWPLKYPWVKTALLWDDRAAVWPSGGVGYGSNRVYSVNLDKLINYPALICSKIRGNWGYFILF